MTGILKLMLSLSLLVAAGYALLWLWTGELPRFAGEVFGTLGIITIASLAILVLSKPGRGTPKA